MNISKRQLSSLVNSLRDFLKTFDKASKCYKFQYGNPKSRLDLQSQKTISLVVTITISLNIQIDKFVHPSDVETTLLAFFPPKWLIYRASNLFLQKLWTLTIAKFTMSTRNDITLQTSVKQFRPITMCSAFTPDCGCDNSTINLTVDVFCRWIKCSGKPAQKEFSISRHEVLLTAMRLCVLGCAIFLLKIKQIPFFRLVREFTFLKRDQNQFKDILEMSFVLAGFVSTERKTNHLTVM